MKPILALLFCIVLSDAFSQYNLNERSEFTFFNSAYAGVKDSSYAGMFSTFRATDYHKYYRISAIGFHSLNDKFTLGISNSYEAIKGRNWSNNTNVFSVIHFGFSNRRKLSISAGLRRYKESDFGQWLAANTMAEIDYSYYKARQQWLSANAGIHFSTEKLNSGIYINNFFPKFYNSVNIIPVSGGVYISRKFLPTEKIVIEPLLRANIIGALDVNLMVKTEYDNKFLLQIDASFANYGVKLGWKIKNFNVYYLLTGFYERFFYDDTIVGLEFFNSVGVSFQLPRK